MGVLIVTEGGKQMGFGHLARCLPIYNAFREANIEVVLYANTDKIGENFLGNTKFISDDWHIDNSKLISCINSYNIVLLDSLLISEETYSIIAKKCNKLVVIDDLGLRKYYRNETIINWLVLSEKQKEINTSASYLKGAKYAPIREKFCLHKAKNIREKITKVVITMGGTDLRNLSIPIIDSILRYFPQLEISTFVADGFNNKEEFNKYLGHNKINIIYSPTDSKIVEVIKESDVAIATGGHSIYELASLGIPTIHLLIIDNQKKAEMWKETGFTYFVGWFHHPDILERILKGIKNLESPIIRKKMSQAGQNTINDNGAKKIVKELQKWL